MTKEEAVKQLEHERDFSREMEACWAKVYWGDRPKHLTDPMVMSARHRRIADALDMAISALNGEAEPVVHCQDCKHQRKVWRPDKRYKAGGYWIICGCERNEDQFVAHTVDGQDGEFCSAGERKE